MIKTKDGKVPEPPKREEKDPDEERERAEKEYEENKKQWDEYKRKEAEKYEYDGEDTKQETEQPENTQAQEGQEEETKTPELTTKEMDDLILRNFFMCVIRHIKDSELPLEPSQLQGDYMYRYEHKDLGKIDFKKSSFNKVTKFLKKMKQQKYVSFTKPKGVDHDIITEINRKSKCLWLKNIH